MKSRNVTTLTPPAALKSTALRPHPAGSAAILFALAIAAWGNTEGTPVEIARRTAALVGTGLFVSVLFDLKLGFQNLIRTDLMTLFSLYFLTLFEFLFRQDAFNSMVTAANARDALFLCLLGFAGLVLGRHLIQPSRRPNIATTLEHPLSPKLILAIFYSALVIGTLPILVAVGFDIPRMILETMGPRFSQSWSRGRFGDWRALLYELTMFLNLAPPLAGMIVARWQKYSKRQLIFVALGLLFLFFNGFAGGTRYVLAVYCVTFVIAYGFALSPGQTKRLIVCAVVCGALFFFPAKLMLKFRNVGLQAYLEGALADVENDEGQGLMVDMNLVPICRITEYFPNKHKFLGWEGPYLALIRPIPRAIWSGKPKGASFTVEDFMGSEAYTIATTFIGESYMAGGMLAVFGAGVLFGSMSAWWNRLASSKNSELGILVYSSGFFAAVITMRSFSVLTTALLPTLAGMAIASILAARSKGVSLKSPVEGKSVKLPGPGTVQTRDKPVVNLEPSSGSKISRTVRFRRNSP